MLISHLRLHIAGFATCLLLSACTTLSNAMLHEPVKPWERDILARDAMQMPYDDMHAFSDDHIYFSKEAATGGNGVGGGGCGCN